MIQHEQTCTIVNTRTEVGVEAEVTHFKANDSLTVYVAANKIILKYNPISNVYIGNSMGMEFTSNGPKYYETKNGRY